MDNPLRTPSWTAEGCGAKGVPSGGQVLGVPSSELCNGISWAPNSNCSASGECTGFVLFFVEFWVGGPHLVVHRPLVPWLRNHIW